MKQSLLLLLLACVQATAWSQQPAERQAAKLLAQADSLINIHQYSKAKELANQVLKKTPNIPKNIASAYVAIGRGLKGEADYEGALENYYKALRIRRDVLKDKIATARTCNNILSALHANDELEEALRYGRLAEDIYLIQRSFEADSLRAMLYNNMANIYDDLDSLDKAIEINRKGLALFPVTKDTATKVTGEYGLAERLIDRKDYKEAKKHLDTVLLLNAQMETPDSILLGRVFEALGVIEMNDYPLDFNKIIEYYAKAEDFTAPFEQEKSRMASIFFNLGEAYEKIGNLKEAQEAYEQARNYTNYAVEGPDFNQLIRSRGESVEIEIQRDKVATWLTIALIGLVIALSIAAVFIYLSYRNEKEKLQASELLLEKEKKHAETSKLLLKTERENNLLESQIFKLRHDVLKNYLQTIDRLIVENAPERPGDTFEKIRYLINEVVAIAGYSNDPNIVPKTLKALAKALHLKAETISGMPVINLTNLEDIPDIKIAPFIVEEITLIVVEAFTNIRKYAFGADDHAKTVSIRFEYHYESGLTLIITDNGNGFNPEETAFSGLQSMKTRAANLGGKLVIQSEKDKGTSIRFSLSDFYEGSR